jgi:hypothetical protein
MGIRDVHQERRRAGYANAFADKSSFLSMLL